MKYHQRVVLAGAGLLTLFSAASLAHESGDPTDPNASVPATVHQPVMSGYEGSAIVGRPGDWRELNDRAEQIGGPGGQLRGTDEPIRER
jgi:hypothetical protein